MKLESLEEYGISTADGIARCMNSEQFYIKMLSLFLKDTAFTNAEHSYENNDYTSMFSYFHEMKGSCGNLGLHRLYESVSAIVEILRLKEMNVIAVDKAFADVKSVYTDTYAIIKKFIEETETASV